MTILGPDTLTAIHDYQMAKRLAERRKRVAERVEARNGKAFYVERRQRLADLRRRQREFQARQMAAYRGLGKYGGLGREDVRVALMREHKALSVEEANEIARAAVFGAKQ